MHSGMTNLEVAELLRSVAAVYELKFAFKKRFEIIAYTEAADSIEHLSTEVKDVWREGKLDDIPGIGTALTAHLDELFRTGSVKKFKELFKTVPGAIFPLMEIPGIGPKSAYKLVTTLKLNEKDAIAKLTEAASLGKIAGIEGFGVKSQSAILTNLGSAKEKHRRFPLPYASSRADELVVWLKKDPSALQIERLGSLRRRYPTVGDIDLVVATKDPESVIKHFINFKDVTKVIETGPSKASILISGNLQVDLRVQDPGSFGSLLQHFTGSKAHNIALREFALKKDISLSEYGIKKDGKTKKFKTEQDFYAYLGMQWIPPELRENMGEIEAAKNNALPTLVELKDIKADLQIHSNFDIETSHDIGSDSMEEIIAKGNELGYEYLAFTEHNPAQRNHKQADFIELIKRKSDVIQKLNAKLGSGSIKRVFNSLEIDILPNGLLPIEDNTLDLLDFALVSIHSSFHQSKTDATKRILAALSHPKVKIFAHPTTRKVMGREGIELDWEAIFDYVAKNDKWLEINADPSRLDLPDTLVKEAVKRGIKLTLGTDSHSAGGLHNMRFGVDVARRGWAEKNDIVNTRSLSAFLKLLKISL